MKKKQLILIILFSFPSWGAASDFINETLHYSVKFRSLSAGKAILSMKTDTINGKETYLLTSTIKTNSFLSNFYKVRDEINSWLSTIDFSLIKTTQKIREGRYKKNNEAFIIDDNILISNNKKIPLSGKIYDPMAFIYFLRQQKLKKGNQYSFFSYSPKKIKEIIVKITDKKMVKTEYGKYDCYVIEPFSKDGKPLLKNRGAMQIWLSADSLHIPIMIKQYTNLGNMTMQLKSIN